MLKMTLVLIVLAVLASYKKKAPFGAYFFENDLYGLVP